MTLIIIAILLIGYVLIATSSITHINNQGMLESLENFVPLLPFSTKQPSPSLQERWGGCSISVGVLIT